MIKAVDRAHPRCRRPAKRSSASHRFQGFSVPLRALRGKTNEGVKMKRALIVYGGWEGHEPRQTMELFAPILQGIDFEVEVSGTLDAYLDREKMQALSLLVPIWTMGTITGEQESGL